jgi:hypothetical protein
MSAAVTMSVFAALLTGCATSKPKQFVAEGFRPPEKHEFLLKADASSPSPALEPLVRQALQAAGWKEAPDAVPISLRYSVRPLDTGVYSDASQAAGKWLLAPQRKPILGSRRYVHRLELALDSGTASQMVGADLVTGKREASHRLMERLSVAAASSLSADSSKSSSSTSKPGLSPSAL